MSKNRSRLKPDSPDSPYEKADPPDSPDEKVDPPDSPYEANWFRSSDDVRRSFASGNSFEMKPVTYSAIGGMAIFEGDIALGTVEELQRIADSVADPDSMPISGVIVSDDRFRWPDGVIPYEISPTLTNPQRVTQAIEHWMDLTPLRFVEHVEGDPAHENYLSFEELDGCWSQVGMRGGKQVVSLGPSCGLGSAIHEIGHAAGLWHEQSRQDRDQFIRVLWENIQEGREHNFDQHITDGDDVGTYDYASIMHYPALAFSKNGQPTIVTTGGQPIGQRVGLSEGDIAAIRFMYGEKTPQPTAPGQGGAQALGSIPPYDSRRWITEDWPIEVNVLWSVIPSPVSVRIEWNVVTERQTEELLKYSIEIRNLSPQEAHVEVRYTIF